MRNFLLAAAVCLSALLMQPTKSEAGGNTWQICYTTSAGYTRCQRIRSYWRLRGVQRPYCAKTHCPKDYVTFTLTSRRIRQLRRYTNISLMDPGHTARIFTPHP